MEIYGCFIAGLSYKDIQTIIEERDNKFAKNRQTKRVATKYFRDTEYEYSEKGRNRLGEGSLYSDSSFIFH